MIFLSKTTADASASGQIGIHPYQDSPEYDNTARISRDRTLDGSTVVTHYGNCELDRDLTIRCRLSLAQQIIVKSYKSNADVLRISMQDGAFFGYLRRIIISKNGETKLYFYLIEELTS